MKKTLIKNALIINEGERYTGSLLLVGERIADIYMGELPQEVEQSVSAVVDARGKWLIPGIIDDQVHFREPGLTHKADIGSESRAAVAGGITTFMDMPHSKQCVAKVWRSAWNGTCLQPACSRICESFFLHEQGSRGRSCSLLYGDGNSHFERTFLRYSFNISISGNGRMIVR